jgi:hypothetical protein
VLRQALSGLQFVITYQQVDGSQMFARMLLIAVAEAGLVLMFFMHLGQEKRGLLLFALCDRLHDIRHRGHAIWLAGQLPHARGAPGTTMAPLTH